VPRQQRPEVDRDELVAVQREDVSALLPLPGRELDPAAAPEPLGLLRADDLGRQAGELLREEVALPGRAGDDHALDPRLGEAGDLVRGERPLADLDERLRTAARGVAHPLGLAAGKDDRLH
jgi:hypothetical protein